VKTRPRGQFNLKQELFDVRNDNDRYRGQHKSGAAAQWGRALLLSAVWIAVAFFLLHNLAHATGTGGTAAVQARVNAVTVGWQTIVQGLGVAILIVAWSFIGYQIAFGGKTMKDMANPAIGTTIAGLAPVLVGWMFS